MNKLKLIVKENYISMLIVIVVTSIVYPLLSLWDGVWTLRGQMMSPIFCVIIYIIIKLVWRERWIRRG